MWSHRKRPSSPEEFPMPVGWRGLLEFKSIRIDSIVEAHRTITRPKTSKDCFVVRSTQATPVGKPVTLSTNRCETMESALRVSLPVFKAAGIAALRVVALGHIGLHAGDVSLAGCVIPRHGIIFRSFHRVSTLCLNAISASVNPGERVTIESGSWGSPSREPSISRNRSTRS